MSRVIEQTPATTVSADDMFLVDGALGTRAIKHSDMSRIYDQEFGPKSLWGDNIPVEVRRNIFRGKNLGPTVTAAQYAAIAAGTFEDLFIGDYWEETVSETETRVWRIVDIEYWKTTGDVNCTTNHVVIMPDGSLGTGKMYEENTVSGGYVGSTMVTSNLYGAYSTIHNFFGSQHILSYRDFLVNSATANGANGGGWYGASITLPTEPMMFGCYVNNQAAKDMQNPFRMTPSGRQLALMRIAPIYLCRRETNWLRDIAPNNSFCIIGYQKVPSYGLATNVHGIRPVFGIIG